MSNSLVINKRAPRDTVNPKINIMQSREQTDTKRKQKVENRQRKVEEAFIKRQRSGDAHQLRSAQIKKLLKGSESPKVSQAANHGKAGEVNRSQRDIAIRISIATKSTWQKEKLQDDFSVTTSSSVDDRDTWSPTTNDDSQRSTSPETDRTSSCDSEHGGYSKALAETLKQTAEEKAALQKQLEEQDEQYQTLARSYEAQRNQRLNDKAKVDDWAEQCQATEDYCDEMQQKHDTQRAATQQRYEAQLQAKD
jgi:hypothetical protein